MTRTPTSDPLAAYAGAAPHQPERPDDTAPLTPPSVTPPSVTPPSVTPPLSPSAQAPQAATTASAPAGGNGSADPYAWGAAPPPPSAETLQGAAPARRWLPAVVRMRVAGALAAAGLVLGGLAGGIVGHETASSNGTTRPAGQFGRAGLGGQSGTGGQGFQGGPGGQSGTNGGTAGGTQQGGTTGGTQPGFGT